MKNEQLVYQSKWYHGCCIGILRLPNFAFTIEFRVNKSKRIKEFAICLFIYSLVWDL